MDFNETYSSEIDDITLKLIYDDVLEVAKGCFILKKGNKYGVAFTPFNNKSADPCVVEPQYPRVRYTSNYIALFTSDSSRPHMLEMVKIITLNTGTVFNGIYDGSDYNTYEYYKSDNPIDLIEYPETDGRLVAVELISISTYKQFLNNEETVYKTSFDKIVNNEHNNSIAKSKSKLITFIDTYKGKLIATYKSSILRRYTNPKILTDDIINPVLIGFETIDASINKELKSKRSIYSASYTEDQKAELLGIKVRLLDTNWNAQVNTEPNVDRTEDKYIIGGWNNCVYYADGEEKLIDTLTRYGISREFEIKPIKDIVSESFDSAKATNSGYVCKTKNGTVIDLNRFGQLY